MKNLPRPDDNLTAGFNRLRQKAERTLFELGGKYINAEEGDINAVFQELQIHQLELEMQNDELRIANEELERQQIKSTGIYDLAPIGYFILDRNGVVEDVNQAGINLLDTIKTRITGKKLQRFVIPGETDNYYRFYRKMLTQNSRQSCRLKMISHMDREFYAQVEGIAINHFIADDIRCYIAILDDTDRIMAEHKQTETRERLQLALEASAAGTWELETDTLNFYLDEFSHQLCAVPGGSFEGTYQSFINLIYPEDREMVDRHFRTALNHEKEIDIDCRVTNSLDTLCYASIRGHMIAETGRPNRFVGIIMDITEKRQIENEAITLKQDQQTAMPFAILNAQENERKRISDSLHDGVSQLLYGIRMKIAQLPEQEAGNIASSVNDLLDTAVSEIRNISFELAPSILTDFGLPATIEELAKRLSSPAMKIKTKFSGMNNRLPIALEAGIFRIIQELLNNCMKHSHAGAVSIEIKKNKYVEIKVIDDGRGFNVKGQESTPAGSGLSSIKNRANLYNGSLTIDSAPGNGTTVRIILRHINP